jgi:hypothetical protein
LRGLTAAVIFIAENEEESGVRIKKDRLAEGSHLENIDACNHD